MYQLVLLTSHSVATLMEAVGRYENDQLCILADMFAFNTSWLFLYMCGLNDKRHV